MKKSTENILDNVPLVSYIILAFNHENYIKDAILSAFEQNYPNIEFIISDDASKDNTLSIIQSTTSTVGHGRGVLINSNNQNLGLAKNINKAVELSSGDIIILSGGDDVAYPDKAKLLVEPFVRNPDILGVHSAFDVMDINGEITGQKVRDNGNVESVEKVISDSYKIVAQSHAFKREVFDFFGPFDSCVNDEGLPLAFRMAALGKIEYIKTPLIKYRMGDGESTRKGKTFQERTIQDPIKHSSWLYNAYRQIKIDYLKVEDRYPLLKNKIEYNFNKYKYFHFVNKNSWDLKALINSFWYGLGLKALRCFLRRNSPNSMLAVYDKLRRN